MKKIIILLLAILTKAQEFDQNFYYRLTTLWQGPEKSLDIINDGKNNKLQ